MAEEKAKPEEKIELQREYIVPLRQGFLKVPCYKKANKAVKTLKEFLAKHMHVEKRDTRKVKLDKIVNEELWYRGIKNPLHKIKVRATKKGGIVYVELAEIPEYVKFKMQRIENRKLGVKKTEIKHDKTNDHTEESEKIKSDSKDSETKEKNKAVAEEGFKENKAEAKAQKHTQEVKREKNDTPRRRQVLQK
jgi:large subunit ribosomal protein L31e